MLVTSVLDFEDRSVAVRMREIAGRVTNDEVLADQAVFEAETIFRLTGSTQEALNAGLELIVKVRRQTHPYCRRAEDRAAMIDGRWQFRWSELEPTVKVTLVFCAVVLGLIVAAACRT
jgi:hypothetical protein